MKRLKQIMQIRDYEERVKQLGIYARELGVSITRPVGAEKIDGKTDETVVIERIQQALTMKEGQITRIIAIVSLIVSVVSALAAWCAVLR